MDLNSDVELLELDLPHDEVNKLVVNAPQIEMHISIKYLYILQVSPASKKARKTAIRFHAVHDIAMLREVVVSEPYAAPHGEIAKRWATIVKSLGDGFTVDTCRKRFSVMIDHFKSKNAEQLRR